MADSSSSGLSSPRTPASGPVSGPAPAQGSETRERILDAATALLHREGGTGLTVAAVAREAGVSKGGLFYHFATKEQIVLGLVDRMADAFDSAIDAARGVPGDALRAYVEATIPQHDTTTGPTGPGSEAVVAVLAAVATDTELLAPVRVRFAAWQDAVTRDAVDPAAATLVRLAVDGWWLSRLLGLAPPTGLLHDRTRALALDMAARSHW